MDIKPYIDEYLQSYNIPEDDPFCRVLYEYASGMSWDGAIKLCGSPSLDHIDVSVVDVLRGIVEGLVEKYHIGNISSAVDWKASSWLLQNSPSTKEVYSPKSPSHTTTNNTLIISHDEWIKKRLNEYRDIIPAGVIQSEV